MSGIKTLFLLLIVYCLGSYWMNQQMINIALRWLGVWMYYIVKATNLLQAMQEFIDAKHIKYRCYNQTIYSYV